ncbi:hypothetical protein WA588_004056, partial [Blastocystis sp. NMH]
YKFAQVIKHGGPENIRILSQLRLPTISSNEILVRIHAAAVNPVDTYIREGGHSQSRKCPYTPGLDCGGEVLLVGSNVTQFKKGDRVFSCGSVSGTYATHGVFTPDQLYRLPAEFNFKEGACIGTGYFTSLYALQSASAIGSRCVFIHGGSGGVGSSLLKILVSMREVKPECKDMKLVATCSSNGAEKILKEIGVDLVVNRRDPNYMQQVKEVNSGKGPDVVFEMLANVNLPSDLEAVNKGGEVIVIGDRGPVTINPRLMMEKGTSVKGISLFNQTKQQREEALSLFYELTEKCYSVMHPLISYEYPIEDSAKAHIEVIDHKKPGGGRIIINT